MLSLSSHLLKAFSAGDSVDHTFITNTQLPLDVSKLPKGVVLLYTLKGSSFYIISYFVIFLRLDPLSSPNLLDHVW